MDLARKLVVLMAKKAFSPKQIPGLRLWLEADRGVYTDDAGTTPATTDGDAIGCWKDQSGNGYDVIQATADNKPLLKLAANGIKGKPTILFDGTDDYLNRMIDDFLTTDSVGSIFLVVKFVALGVRNMISSRGEDAVGDNSHILFRTQATTNLLAVLQRNNDVVDTITAPALLTGTSYMIGIISSGTAYTMRVISVNQELTVAGGGNNGDWFADTANRKNITLGATKISIGPAQFLSGSLSAVLIYSTPLTESNLTNVEKYLSDKYLYMTQIAFDGNSMTASAFTTWPADVSASIGDVLNRNFGVSGQTTIEMIADAVAQIDICYHAGYHKNICVCWEGTNDLKLGAARADAQARLVTYCQARQAAGWQVVIVTILPRSDAGFRKRSMPTVSRSMPIYAPITPHLRTLSQMWPQITGLATLGTRMM